MRGKVDAATLTLKARGITPAYAGKSRECAQGLTPVQDHPRVCGEKGSAVRVINGKLGSPPRMRGKVMDTSPLCSLSRITPAYAGKSLTIQKMTTRSRDHPRVCGEKSLL